MLIDTERVIEEVRTRPQIWQPRHVQYKCRSSRQLAWAEIARALVPHLTDLSRADQTEIEKKIQQRWRTARDSFVKARAQQLESGASGRERSYGYYDAMTFLEPTLRPPLKAQLAHVPPPPPAPGPAGAVAGPSAVRRRRRLRPLPAARASRPVRQTPLDEDDDHFFASLAPMLRALRTEQKLWFRSRVLALALQLQAEEDGRARVEPDSCYRHPSYLAEDAGEGEELELKYCPPSPGSDAAI